MNTSQCICESPVMNLGCPIHGPEYQAFRERMMQPSLTDIFQQSDYFKRNFKPEKTSPVPNRKARRKAAKK